MDSASGGETPDEGYKHAVKCIQHEISMVNFRFRSITLYGTLWKGKGRPKKFSAQDGWPGSLRPVPHSYASVPQLEAGNNPHY